MSDSHSHGAGVHLEEAGQATLQRGLAELLHMSEGYRFHPLVSDRYPLPLALAVYGEVPEPEAVRERVSSRMDSDPVDALEAALVLLELYECNQPEAAAAIPDDGVFLGQVFGSKRLNGWAGTLGDDGSPYTAAPHGSRYFPCNWLWKSMAIYWDGTVPACCADFTGEQIIGDLNRQSLLEIWNGPPMQALREAQVKGRLEEYPLCAGCDAIWQDGSRSWDMFSGARSLVTRAPLPELQPPPGHSLKEPRPVA